MKRRKQRINKKSVSSQMKRILAISILLIIVDIFISFIVIRDIKKQNSQYISNMVELYIQEEDNAFFKLSRQMLSILIGSGTAKSGIKDTLSVLENNSDPLEINIAKSNLKRDFLEYTWDYGADYHFFAFLDKNDMYIDLNLLGESTLGMEEKIRELLAENALEPHYAKSKWANVELSSQNYILKVMSSNGRYLGCYIKADVLLEPLEKLNFTERGFSVLIDEDNQPIMDSKKLEEVRRPLERYMEVGNPGIFSNYFIIEKSFERAPFRAVIFGDNLGIYEKYIAIQVALLILCVATLGTLAFINQYVQKRVMYPIQQFVDNLLKYDDSDQFVFNITSNELRELEQANEQFRNLLRQIKRLKITIYENELNKQEIEMDYLRLQIKPHFYLNCLNLIYQMIDFGHFEEAKKMSFVTSDYLRYLFQKSMDFVEIKNELEHVKNYLEIQKMRYQRAFTYYIEQEEETIGCMIPPLMIQTFVENSIGYAVSLDNSVEITILVFAEIYEGQEYVNISISDTGEGFPEDILQQLEKNAGLEQREDGHQVGITNCIKRMNYLYQDKGSIEFYNSPMGGAVVDIHLPVRY